MSVHWHVRVFRDGGHDRFVLAGDRVRVAGTIHRGCAEDAGDVAEVAPQAIAPGLAIPAPASRMSASALGT